MLQIYGVDGEALRAGMVFVPDEGDEEFSLRLLYGLWGHKHYHGLLTVDYPAI